jgi:hypothetical protein
LLTNWFSSLVFSARGKILPIVIDSNGTKHNFLEIKNCEGLRHLLNESFLKTEKNPFIIYNGTHYITQLEKLLEKDHFRKIISNEEVSFYFFEPLTHYIYNPKRNPLYEPHILKIDNEDHEIEKIRCLELDSIEHWARKNNIKNLKVYCTDYKCWEYYQKIYPSLTLLSMDLFVVWYSQRLGLIENRTRMFCLYKHVNIKPNLITKKFWSGAWRYDPSRHFITAFLAGKNLINNNNVSFYFKLSNEDMISRFWFSWKEFSLKYPTLSKTLLNGNTLLQEIVPLSIEIANPKTIGENGTDPEYDAPGFNIRKSQDPVDSYYESFCAIVQESRVTQPWPNISEKTLNAIKNYRPFLMCAAPGTLQMLKDMGFKTFDAYWPEDYDNIKSNKDRLARICEIIEYIDTFTIEELQKMYTDMIPILKHNNENLYNLNKFYNELNSQLIENSDRTNG